MSSQLKDQITEKPNTTEGKFLKASLVATLVLIIAALVIALLFAYSHDRVGGRWTGENNPTPPVSRTAPEAREPGTLDYGGVDNFPRTDPIR